MSDYTQVTDFSAKDALASGDPEKIASGADMDGELDAISTAIASKVDESGGTLTGGTLAGGTLTGTLTSTGTISGGTVAPSTLTVPSGTSVANTFAMSGASVELAEGAAIASATPDIWAGDDGNTVHVTGTTAITSFGTAPQAGAYRRVIFDGILTLTHGANLNLPSADDITTAAGDTCLVYADTTTQLDVVQYQRASGQPVSKVTQSFIDDAAVGQAQLKTTMSEVSTTTPHALLTLPGGEYGFYPQIKISAAETSVATIGGGGLDADGISDFLAWGSSYVTRIALGADNTATASAQQRHVQASPPFESYRDGDQIPIFVFGLIDKTTGAVLSTYVSEDPPWGNNGPTVLNPLGRLRALARSRIDPAMTEQQKMEAWADFDIWMNDTANGPTIAKEMARKFTQEEKNRDMALIPHPFGSYDPTKHSIVVLSPTDCRTCHALRARHVYGGDSIGEMLHGGLFSIDNEPMDGLRAPEGVLPVRARLK